MLGLGQRTLESEPLRSLEDVVVIEEHDVVADEDVRVRLFYYVAELHE